MADERTPGAGLNDREAQLLQLSGDRIYSLSRRLATADREAQILRAELDTTREMLTEARHMRDILASQVEALLKERDRDYEERAQLRELLLASQAQLHQLLPHALGGFTALARSPIGRVLPQRGSSMARR
jgi:hypothetical protein